MIDRLLDYTGTNGAPSQCRLRVFGERAVPVAVVSEIDDNPGQSVTTAAAVVWRLVWEILDQPDELTMIEHYPHSRPHDETFDRVTFSGPGMFQGVTWSRMRPEDIRHMVGADH